MHWMIRRVASLRLTKGFSLVEVMVAVVVLAGGLIVMSQFFASAVGRVLDSDVRSVLHQVASQDIETIRGLEYADVGTTTGHPQGTLQGHEDRLVGKLSVQIDREVIYWTDPSYTGPYPANYRRVTIIASATDYSRLAPVELTTNVAGGAPGGTLDITVTDTQGNPVSDALITVTNDNLIPHVNISSTALRTDSEGHLIIPGLTPDATPNYVVSAAKSGYNTDVTDPGVVLVDGLPYTVVQLTIDRLSTLMVRVVDSEGTPVEGLNLSIIGPDGFSETVVSQSDGVTFANIRYSTDLDPYVVRLLEGQGYDPLSVSVMLEPGTTREVVLTVPAGGPTTTTTVPTSSTTSTSSTSTTSTTSTTLMGSLTVRVLHDGHSLSGALVSLEGRNRYTNQSGYASFSNLELRTYSIVVTRQYYDDYRGDVVITGASTKTVYLNH